ncbi:MAG: xanthine dehydrogenase family protein molybdopterin-binding subunit [Pseudomonadota bacterium]
MSRTNTYIGQSQPRVEDAALLDGTARFIHDLQPAGRTLAAAFVRSPMAHGTIASLNIEAALALPGVHHVVTGEDVTKHLRPLANILTNQTIMFPLAVARVRYVGEPVALVLADTRALAEDGADLVAVDYKALEPVIDPVVSCQPGTPTLHDGMDSNLVHDREFNYGSPDNMFQQCERVFSFEAKFPRSTAMPLETAGVTADYDPSMAQYSIWSNYGGPLALQAVMAGALKVPVAKLRLIVPDRIGGNFGIRQSMYPYMVLIALAAKLAGRPVRWDEDRNEHLLGASASSERVTCVKGAFQADGRLQALHVEQLENFGAYVRTPEPAGLYRMHGTLTGPYDVQHLSVHNRGVLTNQLPSGLNRGFGGPQFFHALESMMDVAARGLGIDRAELRKRNLVPAHAFPYRCPSGSTLDSGDYQAVLQRALSAVAYQQAIKITEQQRQEGRLVGMGLACSVETSGNNLGYMNLASGRESASAQLPKSGAGATATLSMDATGGILLQLDSPDCGQGYRTVAAQVVADELGVEPTAVEVRTALDTNTTGWILTSGNYANRFSTAVTSAVARAAQRAADKLKRLAAQSLDVSVDEITLSEGAARHPTTDQALAIRRLAGQLHWDLANLPDGVNGPIQETAVFAPSDLLAPGEDERIETSLTYSFQCDVTAIEIDPDTGHINVLKYATVHDAGTVLHPGMFDSQIQGGFAHGLGAALREHFGYDADGQPTSPTLARYAPLRANNLATLDVEHLETPSPNTIHGAKGLGDGCAILAPCVIASAIADALSLEAPPEPPFTPQRVWQLIQKQTS